jgi:hypothetical protein
LSQKPNRRLIIGFVAATVLLLLVSLGSASYYYSTSSSLSAKDQQILRLRAAVLTENESILLLELNALRFTSNIATLDQQVARLENQTAILRMELSVAEQQGKIQVLTYFANRTVSIPANSTVEVTSQAPGHNGTIVFLSPGGCPISGKNVQSTSPQYLLYILVDSRAKPEQSAYYTVNGQPFSLFLENVGPTQVACRFSLLYVEG